MEPESGVYCERVLRDDLAVAYLRGELTEDARDAYEGHFFACDTCYERLQILRDLGTVLPREASAPRAAVARRPSSRTPVWLPWAAAAAFVAVAAGVILRNMSPVGPPLATPPAVATSAPPASAAPPSPVPDQRPSLETLARVEPPPYAPLVVRGAEPEDAAFAAAMERYVRGDYVGAAAGLRRALEDEADSLEARFYLGVSELLAGHPEPAIRELRSVAAGEDAGFAEAARYYLAKAHLARRDVAAARRELQRLARGEGDHKERAEQLLQALRAEP